MILRSAVEDLKIERIITSKIEHHAVLHTVWVLKEEYNIQVDYVNVNADGSLDLTHLSNLLSNEKKTLVSLMHVNNETGAILDLDRVGLICKQYNALFHSDTVQSVGKTEIDLQKTPVDFILASAHKFHGPKGIGFAFVRKKFWFTTFAFWWRTGKRTTRGNRSCASNCWNGKSFVYFL